MRMTSVIMSELFCQLLLRVAVQFGRHIVISTTVLVPEFSSTIIRTKKSLSNTHQHVSMQSRKTKIVNIIIITHTKYQHVGIATVSMLLC